MCDFFLFTPPSGQPDFYTDTDEEIDLLQAAFAKVTEIQPLVNQGERAQAVTSRFSVWDLDLHGRDVFSYPQLSPPHRPMLRNQTRCRWRRGASHLTPRTPTLRPPSRTRPPPSRSPPKLWTEVVLTSPQPLKKTTFSSVSVTRTVAMVTCAQSADAGLCLQSSSRCAWWSAPPP